MELNEKLQELRKQKGLTQEELAEVLFVSRTAISKWESGRGVPNIDSLKAISKYFSVSLDDLLSGEELLTIAEDDSKQRENHIRDLIFGLLDCGVSMLLFLPFFGETDNGQIVVVSLLGLSTTAPWLQIAYFIVVTAIVILGILTLAMQNYTGSFWCRSKAMLSLLLCAAAAFLFIISRQPYAAAFVFVFLVIKTLLLLKRH